MFNISKSLDQVMVDITVSCMLNPENPDFYIGTLTLDKVQSLFAEMDNPSTDIVSIFWKAFHIASAKYKEQHPTFEMPKDTVMCPECHNLLGYVRGLRCPNCDYIEE